MLQNYLYHGDNLDILRRFVEDESVDLVYLDPPFNSKQTYSATGKDGTARAFEDTWKWDEQAAASYAQIIADGDKIGETLRALHMLLGASDAGRDKPLPLTGRDKPLPLTGRDKPLSLTGRDKPLPLLAYLVMMVPRLVELWRVLKPTGSLYLHCDPAASHYLKILLDAIFGARNFRNEIIWHYMTGGAGKEHYARKHDILLFYTRSDRYRFYPERIKEPRSEKALARAQRPKGARIARDNIAKLPTDVWQIPALNPMAAERLGYPTQKPLALLERVILASSDEGEVVLDPCCGCGTTIAAAQRLGRRWIGIDTAAIAIDFTRDRLRDDFGIDVMANGCHSSLRSE
jgi:DNA modification methylase